MNLSIINGPSDVSKNNLQTEVDQRVCAVYAYKYRVGNKKSKMK